LIYKEIIFRHRRTSKVVRGIVRENIGENREFDAMKSGIKK